MYSEARKLHIIEAVLKTENEAVLTAIETIVDQNNATSKRTKRFSALLGSLTNEEAESMKKHHRRELRKNKP